MANKLQIKRTTVSGRTPNTTNSGNTHFIDTGELALNLTDGKMFSSNGTVYFEVGANLQNLSVTGNATINAIIANGSIGSVGQILASNGSALYWTTGSGSGTVTQVNTGVGLSGGPITSSGSISVNANDGIVANSTGLFVNPGTGTVVNATGVHVNSSYIGTLAANSSTYLGGNTASDLRGYADTQSGTAFSNAVANAASYTDTKAGDAYTNATAYSSNATNISSGTLDAARLPAAAVQNTDSRTLSGNLVISGTSFTPSSNTVLLGNATQRWVLSANTGDFTGTVSHTLTGTATTGGAQIYLNGATLNRIDFNTNGVAAPAYTTRSSGTKIALYPAISGSSVDYALGVDAGALWTSIPGNDAGQFFKWYGGETQVGSLSGTGMMNITGAANAVSHTVGSDFIANSTAIVGTGYANISTSVNSALLTVGSSFIANTTGAYHTGTINAASFTTTGLVANTTAIVPTSNTILLGNTIGRFVVSANTGDFSGAITSSGGVNPASNSTGTNLGSSTARWVLNANSGNFTANIAMNSNYITGLSDPSNAQDAATKAYVDTFAQGLHIHESCAAATTDTLATLTGGVVTYDNGTSGIGATLTLAVALTTLDGYTLVNGDRIIVKNQANTAHNGIYTRTSSTVLTRSTDFDTGAEVAGGDFTFVTNGTLYNSTGWVQIDQVTTMGTDAIAFQQFSGQGTFTAGQYLYLVGSQFNANATSTSSASVLIARDASQNFAANTANLITINAGTVNATSNGLIANSTTITVGNTSVNVTITPTNIDLGTSFDANSTGLYHTGTVNAASITTTGFVANTTAIVPTSNTILLGNSIGRFVLSANTGSFSGAVSGITTLAAGNTTVTGFINATSTIQGGSSLTIAGAASGITTLATGNTTVTGFVNATSTIQGGSSLTIAGAASGITTLAAGNTTITGFANASVSVNSALLTVGTSFIANTTGAYHTGTVNAVSFTSGTINATSNGLISNSTTITVGNSSVNVSITTAGITSAGGTGVNPSSNTVGTALGTSTQRWVLNANTGSFAGAVSGITTLAAGNTTVTGFVNATSTIQGGSSLTIAGAASGITTLAAGNTTITGFANVSVSVNSALLTVGSSFIANTTGVYHTGVVNAATLSVGSSFVANSTTINFSTINATSNGITANTTAIMFGNSSVNVTINTSSVNVATHLSGSINATSNGLLANSSTITVGNSSVNVTITTAGITSAGGTGVNPSSNTVGTALGTTTQRWVINANTGSFSGAVSGITTLATGNTTITGFANASVSVNSALLTVGTSFIANTLGAYHTGIVNAASHTTTGFVANTTAIAPTSNTILLGNTIGRFVISANTIDTSGLITGGAGATITGQVNASTGFGSGTINATSNGLISNSTTITVGNSSVNVAITTAGITSAGGTGVNPSSNTVGTALGTNTQRWVLNANTGSFAGAVSGITTLAAGNTTVTGFVNATSTIQGGSSLTIAGAASGITTLATGNTTVTGFANVSVSVNSALLTVGSSFIANTTGVYHTGVVNAASHTTTGFVANTTVIAPTSNTILLGNTIGRFVVSANTINATGLITGGAGATVTGQVNASTGFGSGTINATSNGLFANATTISVGNSSVNVAITTAGITSSGGTGVNPSSNTVGTALGTTTQRWVINANTGNFSGLITGTAGATITGQVNASTGFGSGTINATSNGLFANATTISLGNSSVNVAITTAGITSAGGTGVNPSSNTVGTTLGTSTARWVINANTGSFSGAVSGITTLAAGNTSITGFANASVSVNSALLTVGTSFIANTTGAYHTGIVNAASINIGGSGFIANATAVLIAKPLTANGSTGTAGHVLFSNGTVGSPYWAAAAGATAADDTTTNGTRYVLFANQTSGSISTAYVSSTKLTYNPSTGTLTSTVLTASSDEKLKTNINTIIDPISVINGLRGVSFDRIDTKQKDFGVIAQEIEKVLPDVVHQDFDGYKSVSYNSIIGFLIEGMKHQTEKITQLENKLDEILRK